jgi:hypothetical protein
MTKAKQDDRFQILTSLVFVAPSWAGRSFRQHRCKVVSGSRPRLYSPFTPASPSTTKPRRSRSTGTLGFFQVVGSGAVCSASRRATATRCPSTRRTRTNRRSIRNLNFPVDDGEAAVDALRRAGIEFEHCDNGPLKTDEKGIATPGPKQAWFRDPAETSCRWSRAWRPATKHA